MSFAEIQQQAFALSEPERAELAAQLLHTLPAPEYTVSDEEVARRDAELQRDEVHEVSHDEFVRRVQEQRQR
jgi:hypothetical protein